MRISKDTAQNKDPPGGIEGAGGRSVDLCSFDYSESRGERSSRQSHPNNRDSRGSGMDRCTSTRFHRARPVFRNLPSQALDRKRAGLSGAGPFSVPGVGPLPGNRGGREMRWCVRVPIPPACLNVIPIFSLDFSVGKKIKADGSPPISPTKE